MQALKQTKKKRKKITDMASYTIVLTSFVLGFHSICDYFTILNHVSKLGFLMKCELRPFQSSFIIGSLQFIAGRNIRDNLHLPYHSVGKKKKKKRLRKIDEFAVITQSTAQASWLSSGHVSVYLTAFVLLPYI